MKRKRLEKNTPLSECFLVDQELSNRLVQEIPTIIESPLIQLVLNGLHRIVYDFQQFPISPDLFTWSSRQVVFTSFSRAVLLVSSD
jgi:hypothetical protein